jgi:hypothetical protein
MTELSNTAEFSLIHVVFSSVCCNAFYFYKCVQHEIKQFNIQITREKNHNSSLHLLFLNIKIVK